MAKKDMADENLRGEMDEARKKAVCDEAAENEEKDEPEAQEKPKKKEEKKKADSKVKEISEADKLRKELNSAMDAHVRTLAEYDNYRKRTAKEKEAAYGDAKADVLKQLLPVIDNIERSAQSEQGDPEAYKKGVDMIFSSLLDALKKAGLEDFGQPGDKFDPKLHNAVMHVDDENLDDETVADVFSKGYRLGDRVLRPAMVKVAN